MPTIQNFIKSAKKNGATGFGAGNGYMGDNIFYIDNASLYGQGKAGYWGGPIPMEELILAETSPMVKRYCNRIKL